MARTPTYSPHLRIQVSGVLGPEGAAWEIFSYGLSIGRDGSGLTLVPSDLPDMVDDVLAFHSRQASMISAFARVTNVKVASVLPDGKWLNGEAVYERTVNVPGGVGAGANVISAPQVSLAVTLRSTANSPRTRGRFFLPLPAITCSPNDGLVSAATCQGIATSAAQLVADLNNGPGPDDNDNVVVVASTFGLNSPVTSVSVGRVADTIRSRRNALQEAYVSAPVPGL